MWDVVILRVIPEPLTLLGSGLVTAGVVFVALSPRESAARTNLCYRYVTRAKPQLVARRRLLRAPACAGGAGGWRGRGQRLSGCSRPANVCRECVYGTPTCVRRQAAGWSRGPNARGGECGWKGVCARLSSSARPVQSAQANQAATSGRVLLGSHLCLPGWTLCCVPRQAEVDGITGVVVVSVMAGEVSGDASSSDGNAGLHQPLLGAQQVGHCWAQAGGANGAGRLGAGGGA